MNYNRRMSLDGVLFSEDNLLPFTMIFPETESLPFHHGLPEVELFPQIIHSKYL